MAKVEENKEILYEQEKTKLVKSNYKTQTL